VQFLELVDPGDRTPAVADFHQVYDRHHGRVPGGGLGASDHVIGVDLYMSAGDETAFGGRASDVKGNDVRFSDDLPQGCGSPHTACRARFDHGDWNLPGIVHRVDPAVGLHDVEAPLHPLFGQGPAEPVEIVPGNRLYIGRKHGGVRSLVLPPFTGYLTGRHCRDLGPEFLYLPQRLFFMLRVCIRVEETDCNRFDAVGLEVVEN